MEAKLFREDRRTDRQTWRSSKSLLEMLPKDLKINRRSVTIFRADQTARSTRRNYLDELYSLEIEWSKKWQCLLCYAWKVMLSIISVNKRWTVFTTRLKPPSNYLLRQDYPFKPSRESTVSLKKTLGPGVFCVQLHYIYNFRIRKIKILWTP
jgi:hypothetical protein